MTTINIPNNATNGDVIKALFGEPAREEKTGVLYKFMYRNGKPYFSTFYDWDWWNARYKDKPYLQNEVKKSKQSENQTIHESEITIDKNEDGIEISL